MLLLSGAEVKVTFKCGDTIACIRHEVAAAVSKPAHALRLYDMNDQELIDTDSVADAGLGRRSIVKLVCDASKMPSTF